MFLQLDCFVVEHWSTEQSEEGAKGEEPAVEEEANKEEANEEEVENKN